MGTIATRFDFANWLQAAADIEADLRQGLDPLTEAQFHAPSPGGGWSVGFCIEHLVLTGRACLPKWDLALSEARKAAERGSRQQRNIESPALSRSVVPAGPQRAGRGPHCTDLRRREADTWPLVRYPWWQRRILSYVENPAKLKRRTVPALEPCARRPIEETLIRFLEMHRELTRRAAAGRGLDASQTKVQSPFVPWFRYTLAFSFDLVLAHERRHLRQAWQVRKYFVEEEIGEREFTHDEI